MPSYDLIFSGWLLLIFLTFNMIQAFVSEYAVTTGSLLAALGEAGFLIGLEKNRFVVAFQEFVFQNAYNVFFTEIIFLQSSSKKNMHSLLSYIDMSTHN